jgi:uncharacterized protein (DUF58 family)
MFYSERAKIKRYNKDVSLTPLRFQVVTVNEFLELYAEKSSEILSAKIIPPRLGNKDFGKVLIEWKNPVFVPFSKIDNGVFA